MIAILYNRFTGDIERIEKTEGKRARDLTVYKLVDNDTLNYKLKLIKDRNYDLKNITNIEQFPEKKHACKPTKIACIFQGSLGDHVISSALIEGLKRKHGNIIIDAFCSRVPEMLKIYDEIKHVFTLNFQYDLKSFAKRLTSDYEIVYDFGLIGGCYEQGRLTYSKWKDLYLNYSVDKITEKFDRHVLFLKAESVGLKCRLDEIDIVKYIQPIESINLSEQYVTIGGYSKYRSKRWNKWAEIVNLLKKENIDTIQLGLATNPKIEGTIDKRNIGIEATISFLANSNFHLDIDSGLVHLARAVGVPSLVLWGPTKTKNWQYPENLNIVSDYNCQYRPCFGQRQWENCPYNYNCMNSIDIRRVINAR